MKVLETYIAIAIIILAILVFFINRGKKQKGSRITPLVGLAFGFIVAGIAFEEDKLISYGLMGIGVLFSIVDIFIRSREK